MNGRLTIQGTRGYPVKPSVLEPLLVSGIEREGQMSRLSQASLIFTADDRVIAAAVCRQSARELRVDEIGMVRANGDDEMADVVIDALETAALAGGNERLVVFSASRPMRRALRLLGYVPQTVGQRLGFVRHMRSVLPSAV